MGKKGKDSVGGAKGRRLVEAADARGNADEYTVSITIHEVVDISTDDGNAIDAVMVVSCLGNEFVSQVKQNKMDHAMFEESCTWGELKLHKSEFDSANVTFELQSANTVWANDTIGVASISLNLVRKRRNHSYTNKWLHLRDTSKHRGRVRITVVAYGGDDDPPIPGEASEDEDGDAGMEALQGLEKAILNQKLLDDKGAQEKHYNLLVQVHRIESLGGGKAGNFNPYISVSFGGTSLNSSVAFSSHTCVFNESFRIPVTTPIYDDSVIIRVMHKDSVFSKDKLLIQGRLSFASLRNSALAPRYFNFYNFPADEIKDATKFGERAGAKSEPNAFYGRILVSGQVQRLDDRAALSEPGLDQSFQLEEPPQKGHAIVCDIYRSSGMPGSEIFFEIACCGQVSVSGIGRRILPSEKLAMQEDLFSGDKKKYVHYKIKADQENRVRTAEEGANMTTNDPGLQALLRMTPYQELKAICQLPGEFVFDSTDMQPLRTLLPLEEGQQCDVILSTYANLGMPALVKKESIEQKRKYFKRVGYIRMKFKDLQQLSVNRAQPPYWINNNSMAHLPSYTTPGSLLLRLFQSDQLNKKDLERAEVSLDPTPFELRVHICMGRDLATTYQDARPPNPVVEVRCAGSSAWSRPRTATHQPLWMETITLDVDLMKPSSGKVCPEPITISLYDADLRPDGVMDKLARAAADPLSFLKAAGMNVGKGAAAAVGAMDATWYNKNKAINRKKLIGKCIAKVSRYVKPGAGSILRPQWLEIYGGPTNNIWTGDVLFAAELCRKLDTAQVPILSCAPARKTCVVQLAMHSVKEVPALAGSSGKKGISKPTIIVSLPVYSEIHYGTMQNTTRIDWTEKVDAKHALAEDDLNQKWSTGSDDAPVVNFDFMFSMNIAAEIPIDPIWNPQVTIQLFDRDKRNQLIGTGAINIAALLPWINTPHGIPGAIEAMDEYVDGREDFDQEGDDSDLEEIRRRKQQLALVDEKRRKAELQKDEDDEDSDVFAIFLEEESEIEDDEFVGDKLVRVVAWKRPPHEKLLAWIESTGGGKVQHRASSTKGGGKGGKEGKHKAAMSKIHKEDGHEDERFLPEEESGVRVEEIIDEKMHSATNDTGLTAENAGESFLSRTISSIPDEQSREWSSPDELDEQCNPIAELEIDPDADIVAVNPQEIIPHLFVAGSPSTLGEDMERAILDAASDLDVANVGTPETSDRVLAEGKHFGWSPPWSRKNRQAALSLTSLKKKSVHFDLDTKDIAYYRQEHSDSETVDFYDYNENLLKEVVYDEDYGKFSPRRKRMLEDSPSKKPSWWSWVTAKDPLRDDETNSNPSEFDEWKVPASNAWNLSRKDAWNLSRKDDDSEQEKEIDETQTLKDLADELENGVEQESGNDVSMGVSKSESDVDSDGNPIWWISDSEAEEERDSGSIKKKSVDKKETTNRWRDVDFDTDSFLNDLKNHFHFDDEEMAHKFDMIGMQSDSKLYRRMEGTHQFQPEAGSDEGVREAQEPLIEGDHKGLENIKERDTESECISSKEKKTKRAAMIHDLYNEQDDVSSEENDVASFVVDDLNPLSSSRQRLPSPPDPIYSGDEGGGGARDYLAEQVDNIMHKPKYDVDMEAIQDAGGWNATYNYGNLNRKISSRNTENGAPSSGNIPVKKSKTSPGDSNYAADVEEGSSPSPLRRTRRKKKSFETQQDGFNIEYLPSDGSEEDPSDVERRQQTNREEVKKSRCIGLDKVYNSMGGALGYEKEVLQQKDKNYTNLSALERWKLDFMRDSDARETILGQQLRLEEEKARERLLGFVACDNEAVAEGELDGVEIDNLIDESVLQKVIQEGEGSPNQRIRKLFLHKTPRKSFTNNTGINEDGTIDIDDGSADMSEKSSQPQKLTSSEKRESRDFIRDDLSRTRSKISKSSKRSEDDLIDVLVRTVDTKLANLVHKNWTRRFSSTFLSDRLRVLQTAVDGYDPQPEESDEEDILLGKRGSAHEKLKPDFTLDDMKVSWASNAANTCIFADDPTQSKSKTDDGVFRKCDTDSPMVDVKVDGCRERSNRRAPDIIEDPNSPSRLTKPVPFHDKANEPYPAFVTELIEDIPQHENMFGKALIDPKTDNVETINYDRGFFNFDDQRYGYNNRYYRNGQTRAQFLHVEKGKGNPGRKLKWGDAEGNISIASSSTSQPNRGTSPVDKNGPTETLSERKRRERRWRAADQISRRQGAELDDVELRLEKLNRPDDAKKGHEDVYGDSDSNVWDSSNEDFTEAKNVVFKPKNQERYDRIRLKDLLQVELPAVAEEAVTDGDANANKDAKADANQDYKNDLEKVDTGETAKLDLTKFYLSDAELEEDEKVTGEHEAANSLPSSHIYGLNFRGRSVQPTDQSVFGNDFDVVKYIQDRDNTVRADEDGISHLDGPCPATGLHARPIQAGGDQQLEGTHSDAGQGEVSDSDVTVDDTNIVDEMDEDTRFSLELRNARYRGVNLPKKMHERFMRVHDARPALTAPLSPTVEPQAILNTERAARASGSATRSPPGTTSHLLSAASHFVAGPGRAANEDTTSSEDDQGDVQWRAWLAANPEHLGSGPSHSDLYGTTNRRYHESLQGGGAKRTGSTRRLTKRANLKPNAASCAAGGARTTTNGINSPVARFRNNNHIAAHYARATSSTAVPSDNEEVFHAMERIINAMPIPRRPGQNPRRPQHLARNYAGSSYDASSVADEEAITDARDESLPSDVSTEESQIRELIDAGEEGGMLIPPPEIQQLNEENPAYADATQPDAERIVSNLLYESQIRRQAQQDQEQFQEGVHTMQPKKKAKAPGGRGGEADNTDYEKDKGTGEDAENPKARSEDPNREAREKAAKAKADKKAEAAETYNASREMVLGLRLNQKIYQPCQVIRFFDDKAQMDWGNAKLKPADLILGFGIDKKKLVNVKRLKPVNVVEELAKVVIAAGRMRPLFVSRRRLRGDETIVLYGAADEPARVAPKKQDPAAAKKQEEELEALKNDITRGGEVKTSPKGLFLEFRNDSSKPPSVLADRHPKKVWTMHGIQKGAMLTLLNGMNVEGMTWQQVAQQYKEFLERRPVTMVFRLNRTSRTKLLKKHLEKEVEVMGKQFFKLDGTCKASFILKQTLQKSGKFMPRVFLSMKRLNFRPVRSRRLEIQGMPQLMKQKAKSAKQDAAQDQGMDTRRKALKGLLEDTLPENPWKEVTLYRGSAAAGYAVLQARVLYKNMLPHRSAPSVTNEQFQSLKLRQHYKEDIPPLITVRAYIVRGVAVAFSDSPSLFFKFGPQTVQYGQAFEGTNAANPMFFRTEERNVTFPIESRLEIGLFSKQKNGREQNLGSTVIDLELRWHSAKFQQMVKSRSVPLEFRPLIHSRKRQRKGSLEMWLELVDAERASDIPPSILRSPTPVTCEIRVVVWTVKDISFLILEDETGEEVSRADMMVRAGLDSKFFKGQQPAQQETDVHYQSSGFAEYNWRFVYSNIEVRKGFPLDAEITLTLFRTGALLATPFLVAETVVDIKPYLGYVAQEQQVFTIEAEIPMTNKKLYGILKDRLELQRRTTAMKMDMLAASGGDDGDIADDGTQRKDLARLQRKKAKLLKKNQDMKAQSLSILREFDQVAAAASSEGKGEGQVRLPAAAKIYMQLQVMMQNEASQEGRRVGLGRKEPNRDPVLSYPTSGRTWDVALPNAKLLIEGAIDVVEGLKGAKSRFRLYIMLFLVIAGLYYFRDRYGCMYLLQASCCQSCGLCNAQCRDGKVEQKAVFCIASYQDYLVACPRKCSGNCLTGNPRSPANPNDLAEADCEQNCEGQAVISLGGSTRRLENPFTKVYP